MKVALPFYSEDNFVKIKTLLPNEGWPMFYDDWLDEVQRREKNLIASRNVPVRIDVEPESFEAWCKSKNQKPTRPAILNYCIFILAQIAETPS